MTIEVCYIYSILQQTRGKKKSTFYSTFTRPEMIELFRGSSGSDVSSAIARRVHFLPCTASPLPWALSRGFRSLQLPAACPTPLLQQEHQSQLGKIEIGGVLYQFC